MQNTLFTLFNSTIGLVNKLIYILISLALVVFMWGIVKYLFNASSPDARKEARAYMLYGVMTLFVMTSVWSIVYLFKDFIEPNAFQGTGAPVTSGSPTNNSIQGTSFENFGQ